MKQRLQQILTEINHDLDFTTRYDDGTRQGLNAIANAIEAYLAR